MGDIPGIYYEPFSGSRTFPQSIGLLPLTTTYTYASSCLSRWSQPYPDSSSPSNTLLYSTHLGNSHFVSCQPGGITDYGRYSPGVCPSGRTIGMIRRPSTMASEVDRRIWIGYCCPSGFAYNYFSEKTDYFCTSSMASSYVVAYRSVVISFLTTISGTVFTTTGWAGGGTQNSTTVSYASLFVDPVEILWQSSDLSLFGSSVASQLARILDIPYAATPTTSMPESRPPSASPGLTTGIVGPTTPPSPSPDLSTGAKAGIGVGAALGALAIVAVLLLVLRLRKRKTTHTNAVPTHNAMAVEAPELVQYYNPVRQSDALSGTTYTEHIPKTPTSPMSPSQ